MLLNLACTVQKRTSIDIRKKDRGHYTKQLMKMSSLVFIWEKLWYMIHVYITNIFTSVCSQNRGRKYNNQDVLAVE